MAISYAALYLCLRSVRQIDSGRGIDSLPESGPENAGAFTSDKVYDKRFLSYSRLRRDSHLWKPSDWSLRP
jgi:hypothetical protein